MNVRKMRNICMICRGLLIILGIACLIGCMDASAAFASGGSGGMPWESGLSKVKDSITGPTATLLALVAIVGAIAALLWGGDITGFTRTAAFLALGIGVLVMADKLLSAMYAKSAGALLLFG